MQDSAGNERVMVLKSEFDMVVGDNQRLREKVAKMQVVVDAAVGFYPYVHNIAIGLQDYQPTSAHAAEVMANSVQKMNAIVDAVKALEE